MKLCSSPLITYPVPYILTEQGQKCELLAFIPSDLYWSPLFAGVSPALQYMPEDDQLSDENEWQGKDVFPKETHPFVFAGFEKGMDSREIRGLLASYRADGGKLGFRQRSPQDCDEQDFMSCENCAENVKKTKKVSMFQHNQDDTFHPTSCQIRHEEQFQTDLPLMVRLNALVVRTHVLCFTFFLLINVLFFFSKRDCFDPFLHQTIAILFSSYSQESANFPRPCISPW